MASFKRKLLLSLAITTIFLLRCGLVEGSYSYNGVRYSYSCARWIYMGTTIRWKYGTPLSAPFFGMSYACDSDTSANKRGLHEPSVCGESCRHFCDFENTFFSLRILKDGIALPETDANCQSSPCVDPELGSANVICYNHRLKPDGKTKYTMRLVVDAPHDPDAKPLRNQDADLYIIAGDVVPQNSRGSWASESSITAGSQGRFMLQLMDEFENEVGSETGKEGADLDVEFSVSVTEGHAADPGAVTDLICRRNGNTGTYAVTFTTAKIGDYNLHVQAVIDSRSYSVIGSPFSFRVISGPVDQGKPVMPRVVHKAEKVWADDYPTFKVSSSQADDNAVEGSPFFFTVKAGPSALNSGIKGGSPSGGMHAPACSASGSGLFGGTAGYSQEFVIYTFTSLYIAAYVPGSSFRLYFKPPVDANPVLLDTSTNAVDVSYRITVVGEYQMSVLATNFSAQIRGSPFTVRITAGPLSIEKCGGYLQGGNPVLSVDKYPVFIIQQKDAFGNKIYSDNISDIHNYTITVLTSSGIPVPVEAVLNLSSSNKDEILATFNLTEVGNYTLQVGDSSGSINGIPNQISMVEGPVVTSDQCKAKFAPDGSLHRGMSLKIVITTYVAAEPTISKYALSFGITSVPPLSAEPNVFEDMKDGTYVTTIKLSSVGNFKFVIDLFGAPIAGSPFNFAIKGETTTVIHTQLDDVWTWENHQITFNVLTNDYSIPAVPLILVHMTPPIGIFTMSENGTVVYNPSENFTGFLRVTYEVEAETGETSFGDVFITVVSQQQPYISAYPKSLVGLEDQPLPPVGAIQNLEVVSLEPEMVISAELSALHGRIYPAAGMSGNWSMVTVVLSNDVSLPPENVSGDGTTEALYDETGPLLKAWGEMAIQNDESHALRFSATLERMNSALKALQYVGLQNFNGEDTVSFSVHNGRGLGCTKTISVYVWPVNDPPFVTGPSFISIHLSNETTGENLTQFGVPITNLSVGDPDADDASGSMYALAGVLQLEKGQFGITIPNSSSASYVTPGARNWSLVSDPQVTIWAQSVRFKASIPDWNAALQGLVLKTDNVNRQKLGLSLLIDDMGQFGVGGDWSRTSPYPYVIQYQTVIMIYEIGYKSPFRLKAFVKFILYAMGGIVGMVGVFYLAGKLGLQYYLPRWKGKSAEEDEEKNYKMIRVYNPLWLPTYQKAETTTGLEPTGSGFEIQQDWKMETMQAPDVMPPLGNESMPLDISSGGTDTSQQETEPGNPSQGGLSARKFSVKWSADAGMGNSGSSVRGTEITSEMFVLGEQDVTSPRSPDILPDVSFWQEVVTDFTPPSPDASSAASDDEDDDEESSE